MSLLSGFEDDVGKQLHAVLLKAAQRGVRVEVLLDGYGSPDLSESFVGELTSAGVIFRYYDPRPRLLGMRTNLFRRMHRKIVVIDDVTAFVGGINYSAEHMTDYGPEAKQDYAVQVEGPVVIDILQFELENLPTSEATRRWWQRRRHKPEINRNPGEAQALFIWRDNQDHRDDIERHYLKMLTSARREVIIANAYFSRAIGCCTLCATLPAAACALSSSFRVSRIFRLSNSARACSTTIW